MKLLAGEFNLLLPAQTVRCWTPSRWLPHTPPALLVAHTLFAFIGIIPCYIPSFLSLACLSKTVASRDYVRESLFSISSLLWSNITSLLKLIGINCLRAVTFDYLKGGGGCCCCCFGRRPTKSHNRCRSTNFASSFAFYANVIDMIQCA